MSKAAATRETILKKAFDLVYRQSYQATSIDDIISQLQVTKGAFFYHFRNKDMMGLAMIREVMAPNMEPYMIHVLGSTPDALEDIYQMVKGLLLLNPTLDSRYGCPAVNLIEEMAPVNEEFRKALMQLMLKWQDALEKHLREAQIIGQVGKEHDAKQIAMYITAGYSGIRNIGKIFGNQAYVNYLQQFKIYLESLR
ncbi:TetR/AcrR family transcriptional regulator [Pedobacter sp. JY14-1]|uniref:TetR/AcrR family transcriptional regulator n=1 Tax=Pedobacter sp. JY14-1 TaxID=3034151 RepID=UPI0023E1043B|nr:TetR/AcrR family transcriptional regulator [Pedobacter sp. JY14-1]